MEYLELVPYCGGGQGGKGVRAFTLHISEMVAPQSLALMHACTPFTLSSVQRKRQHNSKSDFMCLPECENPFTIFVRL